MSNDTLLTVYHGAFIHSLSLTVLEVVEHGLLAVDADGLIAFVEQDVQGEQAVKDTLDRLGIADNTYRVRVCVLGKKKKISTIIELISIAFVHLE